MTLDLFQHDLCTNLENEYEISKKDAEDLHTTFAHYHVIMTEINNEPLLNALWLQDNLFQSGDMTTQEMFDKVMKHATRRQILRKQKEKDDV